MTNGATLSQMSKLVAASVIALALVQAQPDVEKIGPQVGERVPDFSLVDQSGTTRTLQSVAGKNGVMLVFFRSADW
jgi:hypothetical protein